VGRIKCDILDYYADNGEAFLADKNLNPESVKLLSEIAQLEYYLCYAMELSFIR
jgi:hypothetical protein